MENVGKIIIVWGRKEIEIPDVNLDDTVRGLKERIHQETGILPGRQKLLNLRTKDKASQDEEILRNLGMKPGFKLMLMGSREEDIAKACHAPKDLPDVINDFEIEEEVVEIENVKLCLFQIKCRIENYSGKWCGIDASLPPSVSNPGLFKLRHNDLVSDQYEMDHRKDESARCFE
ncbi:Ubiquitin-like domain-containing CTD phosphatase 1 [Anthophora plagiata]